jgi:hypothetical protein
LTVMIDHDSQRSSSFAHVSCIYRIIKSGK